MVPADLNERGFKLPAYLTIASGSTPSASGSGSGSMYFYWTLV